MELLQDLQTDPLIYANKIRTENPNKIRNRLMAQREIPFCCNCPLPRCHMHSRDCPIRPVMGLGGHAKNGNTRIPPRRRAILTRRHGRAVQQHLRAHGPSTCADTAAQLNADPDDIHTTIASLAIEHGAPIIPTAIKGGRILYGYAPGTESQPIINTSK